MKNFLGNIFDRILGTYLDISNSGELIIDLWKGKLKRENLSFRDSIAEICSIYTGIPLKLRRSSISFFKMKFSLKSPFSSNSLKIGDLEIDFDVINTYSSNLQKRYLLFKSQEFLEKKPRLLYRRIMNICQNHFFQELFQK